MRCPYCGGINREQAAYCVNCGRVMQNVPNQQQPRVHLNDAPHQQQPQVHLNNAPTQPSQRSYPPAQQHPAPAPNQPARPSQQRPTAQPAPQQTPASRRHPAASTPVQTPIQIVPEPPPAPEPPAPFPPRTMEQLHTLLAAGAQPYTIVESLVADGKKKIVRIAYANVTGWQQVATLLKALKEQQEEQYNTIVIQGVLPQQPNAYEFTNGQLQFDRAVRLGGTISSRYVVETGNGFASDAVRFVLNE